MRVPSWALDIDFASIELRELKRQLMTPINLAELDALYEEAERRQAVAIEALSGMCVRVDDKTEQIHPEDLETIDKVLSNYGVTGAKAVPSKTIPGAIVIRPAHMSPLSRQARAAFGSAVHDYFTRIFYKTPPLYPFALKVEEIPWVEGATLRTWDKGPVGRVVAAPPGDKFKVGDPVGVTAEGKIVNLSPKPDQTFRDEIAEAKATDHDIAVMIHKALNVYHDETEANRQVPGGFPETRRALKRATKMIRSRDESVKEMSERIPPMVRLTQVLTWDEANAEIRSALQFPSVDLPRGLPESLRDHITQLREYRKTHLRVEEVMSTLAQNLTQSLQDGINRYKSGTPMWVAVQQGLNWRRTAQESASKVYERVTAELSLVLAGRSPDLNTYDQGSLRWAEKLRELAGRLHGNSVERHLAECVSELRKTLRGERWAVMPDEANGYRKPWLESLKDLRKHLDDYGRDQRKIARDEMAAAVTKVLEGKA